MAASVATPSMPQTVDNPHRELSGTVCAPAGCSGPQSNVETMSTKQQLQTTPIEPQLEPSPQTDRAAGDALNVDTAAQPDGTQSQATAFALEAATPALPSRKASSSSKKTGASKKKTKKSKKAAPVVASPNAPCIGLYLDALDTKMMWCEAQIIDCNAAERKIKVHFIGWGPKWDLWTDPFSIAGHGTCVPLTKKGLALKRRWDGTTNIFSDSEALQQPRSVDSNNSSSSAVSVPMPPPQSVPMPSSQRARATKPSVDDNADNDTALSAPAAAVRTARPLKAAIERKRPSKDAAATKRTSTAATSAVKTQRTGSAAAAAKAPAAASLSVTNKKRSKASSSVEAAAEVTQPAAVRGKRPAAAPRPSTPKRVRETPLVLVPADGAAPIDFAAARRQHVAAAEQTARFLQQCADVWRQQLGVIAPLPHAT